MIVTHMITDKKNKKPKYTAISLFSGMGGDTLGMINAGLNVVAYSENNKAAKETHEANFKDTVLIGADAKGNITKTTDDAFKKYDGIDFLFAGFPCQSFSSAGKRKVNDPRNTMFTHFSRAAKHTNAKVIIGENVKGLLTKNTKSKKELESGEKGELYIDIIKAEFEKLGYVVKFKVIKCDNHGVPQSRERLFIVGIKKEYLGIRFNHLFPEEELYKANLKNIITFNMEGTFEIAKSEYNFSNIPEECLISDMENNDTSNNWHPYIERMYNLPKTYGGKDYTSLFSFSKRDSPIHCELIDIRNPCKTIICTYDHQPRLLVPQINARGQFVRMITPDELKQIQSFPSDYILCGNTKEKIIQIGNAVPPRIVEKLIKSIIII
jgi:DNA (cytosine-5)-methyltransferase 1